LAQTKVVTVSDTMHGGLSMLEILVVLYSRILFGFSCHTPRLRVSNQRVEREGIASMSFGFRQPSCRVFNEHTGIVNAYDSFTGVTKDGKVQTLHGRTTLVFAK
jgi:hypothetical protein